MSLTASRQALQSIRGSIESALTKISQIKTESSTLATDSDTTYKAGLSTSTYSETARENAIANYHYANYVNDGAVLLESKLNECLNIINQL